MKKIFVLFVVGMIFLMISGVFAASNILPSDKVELSGKIKSFVENVGREKGANIMSETKVSRVDLNEPPKNLDLKNIDNTNLAIYEVDSGDGKPVYVLTLSQETFNQLEEYKDYKGNLLNFGISGEKDTSVFLETATGVETSLEKGYVMMREGSITALSTNLEIVESGEGEIEVIIFRNGERVGFRNTFETNSAGMKEDYDVQSKGVVTFEPGDIISVYLNLEGDAVYSDVITLLEITTQN